jgi:hypothetical protein
MKKKDDTTSASTHLKLTLIGRKSVTAGFKTSEESIWATSRPIFKNSSSQRNYS